MAGISFMTRVGGPLPFVLFSPFILVSLSTVERVRGREREGELACQSESVGRDRDLEDKSVGTAANAGLRTVFTGGMGKSEQRRPVAWIP